MITTLVEGSKDYVQCFSCRNCPILPTVGTVDVDIQSRLQSTADKHERLHSGHQITIFNAQLPIVRDMQERLEANR